MKKIIAFALILLSLSSYSQTEMERVTGLDQWQGAQLATNIRIAPAVTDTIPCIMLVSDTVFHRGFSGIDANGHKDNNMGLYNSHVFWMYGYTVYTMVYSETRYLGADKKPITYFVWMSKNLK